MQSTHLMIVVMALLTISTLSHITAGSAGCHDCFVSQVCGDYKWTKWFDRDNPSVTGDWETVKLAIPLGGCAKPIMIECQTKAGLDHWKTGEVLTFNPTDGCICENKKQPSKRCKYDYKMRELCPA